MPFEARPDDKAMHKPMTYRKALSRLSTGNALCPESDPDDTPESTARAEFIALARSAIDSATDREPP